MGDVFLLHSLPPSVVWVFPTARVQRDLLIISFFQPCSLLFEKG
jgi:hypothetical protein